MTWNLVIWRWSDAYADKNRQRRERLTHGKVAAELCETGDHAAVSPFDQVGFLAEIDSQFPGEDMDKPFVVECYPNAIVFNYTGQVRFEIVPVIGGIARKHGLNSTEA